MSGEKKPYYLLNSAVSLLFFFGGAGRSAALTCSGTKVPNSGGDGESYRLHAIGEQQAQEGIQPHRRREPQNTDFQQTWRAGVEHRETQGCRLLSQRTCKPPLSATGGVGDNHALTMAQPDPPAMLATTSRLSPRLPRQSMSSRQALETFSKAACHPLAPCRTSTAMVMMCSSTTSLTKGLLADGGSGVGTVHRSPKQQRRYQRTCLPAIQVDTTRGLSLESSAGGMLYRSFS